jgi:AAA15 family ATPase/GTPase
MSEQVPVYIKEVAVSDFKGFRGEHRFSFVDNNGEWCQWTVFLGNNNTGKTNLLKAIASLEPKFSFKSDLGNVFYPLGFYLFSPLKKTLSGLKLSIILNDPNNDFTSNIDYSYHFLPNLASGAMGRNESENKLFFIDGYGVIREIENKGITTEENEILNSSNLFNNTKLLNFEDWLFQLDYAAKNNQEKASIRRDILETVLTGDIFPEINNIRFTSDEQLNNYIEFETEDGWHRMSELGYGYQATLSWMADFCKKLFDRYPDSPNPLKEPAVLLVDEIDLHLHPQWQRGLIKSLSAIFPKTQFIVTTHSPFIIQSMENVNLYSLHRIGNQTIEKQWGVNSFIGWSIEEILSDIMDMDGKMHTDRYNRLMEEFDLALDTDDYSKAKAAYDELVKILHPQSAEHKLLDIQFTQLTPLQK